MPSIRKPLRDATSRRSDAQLVRESLDDPDRFDEVFTRHVQAIFVFACARVGPDHAQDVVAETFIAAFRSRSRYAPSATSARPWLYGIAANTLRRHHEHETRWLRRFASDSAGVVDDYDRSVDRVDADRAAPKLARAIATLSTDERDVLLMHVLGEMTHAQIADALGIRRGTAKSRLSRGRARLRALLPELIDEPTRDDQS